MRLKTSEETWRPRSSEEQHDEARYESAHETQTRAGGRVKELPGRAARDRRGDGYHDGARELGVRAPEGQTGRRDGRQHREGEGREEHAPHEVRAHAHELESGHGAASACVERRGALPRPARIGLAEL